MVVLLGCLAERSAEAAAPQSGGYVGNAACAACHLEISASYGKTAMAHASGSASEGPITGSFVHRQAVVAYRIYQDRGKLWLEFKRTNAPALEGRRELLYYIGLGRLKGRTYLFEVGGFLFESPIKLVCPAAIVEHDAELSERVRSPVQLAGILGMPELPYQRNASSRIEDCQSLSAAPFCA